MIEGKPKNPWNIRDIVQVPPMTQPVGGIAFYRPRYGSQVEKPGLKQLELFSDEVSDVPSSPDTLEKSWWEIGDSLARIEDTLKAFRLKL